MSSESIARLGIGYGPLLIARLGIGESGTATAGANLVIEYSITGSVHADYAVEYRIEGQIPQALIPLGGGGPDEEWIHPRVREYLKKIEEDVRAARYVPPMTRGSQVERRAAHNRVTVGSNPTPATINEQDEIEEIEALLMLID